MNIGEVVVVGRYTIKKQWDDYFFVTVRTSLYLNSVQLKLLTGLSEPGNTEDLLNMTDLQNRLFPYDFQMGECGRERP